MTLLPAAPTPSTALNVGSGARPAGNLTFLYVDLSAWPVDVRADLRSLPFGDGQFSHVHCSHVIEHVARAEAVAALQELRRVLNHNGVMYVAAPDMDRARAAGSAEWIGFTRHGGWKPGWGHRWTCSVKVLRRLLIEAGLVPTWAAVPPPWYPPKTHAWPSDFEARFVCRRDDYPWPQSFPSDWQVVA